MRMRVRVVASRVNARSAIDSILLLLTCCQWLEGQHERCGVEFRQQITRRVICPVLTVENSDFVLVIAVAVAVIIRATSV